MRHSATRTSKGPKIEVWNLLEAGVELNPDDPDRWAATCDCGDFHYAPTKRECQDWAKEHRQNCQ